jgi:hypothetical protein
MNDEKTTFTNADIGDEEYKGSDLSEIKKVDTRASVKKAEDLTNQELLAVILSGERSFGRCCHCTGHI